MAGTDDTITFTVAESAASRHRNRGSDREHRAARADARGPYAAESASEFAAETRQDSPASREKVERKPRTKAQPVATPEPSVTRQQSARQVAPFLLQGIEFFATVQVGPEARMAPFERALIEPPLQRTLERMPEETVERFGTFIDPVMILVGFGLYANRVMAIARAKAKPNIPEEEIQHASGGLNPENVATHSDNGQSNGTIHAPIPDELRTLLSEEV